jgi:hypothetical protein
LLRQRKLLRRCAAGKPVIHANRSGNDTLKDQVADFVAVRPENPMTASFVDPIIEA